MNVTTTCFLLIVFMIASKIRECIPFTKYESGRGKDDHFWIYYKVGMKMVCNGVYGARKSDRGVVDERYYRLHQRQ